jgi:N6-adenosine-specific RNA methylase IME4
MAKTIELLRRIWKTAIQTDYRSGILQYEGTLEAALYHHLRSLRASGLSVITQPRFFMSNGRRGKVPDMVVMQEKGKHVDAVIEVKFVPAGIKYQPDIDKLVSWARRTSRSPQKAYLKLDPQTIQLSTVDAFCVTHKTHWIFAGIGPDGVEALCPDFVRRYLNTRRRTKFGHFWLFAGIVGGGSRKAQFDCIPL